jgi:hypothetical protein
MSSAFDAAFSALVDGGMAPAEAAKLLNQIALEGAAAVSKPQPTAGALRVRKHRERKAALQSVTVTPEIEKSEQIQSKVALHVTRPPEPPKKESKKEEVRKDSKISPPAVLRFPVPAPTEIEVAGFVSEDGTINFTAADIKILEAQCPLVENVRGCIVNLAATDWIARKVAPYDRTRAIRAKIKKNQRIEADKQAKAVTPKQVALVAESNKAKWEEQAAEGRRRLANRNRILGIG